MNARYRFLKVAAVAVVLWVGRSAWADDPNTPETAGLAPRVAVFNLEGELHEQAPEFSLGLELRPPQTLVTLLERIAKAAEDPAVPAIVVTFDNAEIGWAQMQELRAALEDVRAAGKEVYCYVEEACQGLYQLATVATRIGMPPGGELRLTGLYLEAAYIKGLLDKVGVEADMVHVGAYKGAGEPLTRTEPSDEARAMIDWLRGRPVRADGRDHRRWPIDDSPSACAR
jgi:protease IV